MSRGKGVILAIFGVALVTSTAAITYLSNQGRRALDYFGPQRVQRILQAPIVVIANQDAETVAWRDISQARGLTNVRRVLVSDASYDWQAPLPVDAPAWDVALRFCDSAGECATIYLSLSAARLACEENDPGLSMQPMLKGLKTFLDEQRQTSRSEEPE